MSVIKIRGSSLYQWDTDRQVEINPYQNLAVDEVHFFNPNSDNTILVIPKIEDGVIIANIPNVLLQDTVNIRVFAVMHTETGERTVKECTFGVIARQKPSDYILPEIKYINDANAFLQRITTGEFPETTGLEYERMKAVETGLEETAEALTEKGVVISSPFSVNDIPQAVESMETDGEYKKLYEDEKTRADTAEENYATEKSRADTAEKKVERLEDALEPLQENKRNLIDLIERDITEIVIPDGVAVIGNSAFYGYTNLTSVTIPDSVTSIGNSAFQECTNLTNVTIPDSVTSIGNNAFYKCTNLTIVPIPNSCTKIPDYCFYSCTSFIEVVIHSGITYIGYQAFAKCNGVKTLNIETTEFTSRTGNLRCFTFVNLEKLYIPQGFNSSVDFSDSKLITSENWVEVFNALADRTGQTAHTLIIGSDNINKLTIEQQMIATLKNWQLG